MKRFEKWKRISALKSTGGRVECFPSTPIPDSECKVKPLHSDAAVDALAALERPQSSPGFEGELEWKANNKKNLKYQK